MTATTYKLYSIALGAIATFTFGIAGVVTFELIRRI